MVFETLIYSREAVDGGAWWRLATATLAHLSIGHLVMNGLALAVVVLLLRPLAGAAAMAAAFAVSALAATLGVHFATGLDWYAGASSATLGLLAWGATRLRRPYAAAALALIAVGAVADLGRTLSLIGEPVAPAAHLWGIVGGVAWALASHGRRALRRTPGRSARSA